MTDRTCRAFALGLLASTALATPAFGQSTAPGTNATDVTAPPPAVQQARDGQVPDPTEIIVTAQKREQSLQNVPISMQAIGTRRLDQLNISNFEDYTKQLPSVSFLTTQPGRPRSTCAVFPPPAAPTLKAITPARCRRSAPIWTSSR